MGVEWMNEIDEMSEMVSFRFDSIENGKYLPVRNRFLEWTAVHIVGYDL